MRNTSVDNRKFRSDTLYSTLEATIVASINILAYFFFFLVAFFLFFVHFCTTTTLVSDPEAFYEQLYEIRFRGYHYSITVPIVSHAEFEIYLFDR